MDSPPKGGHFMQRQLIFIAAAVTVSLIAGLVVLRAQTPKHPDAAGQPSEPRAVLVELFTSEGCSSCPPADALLRQINGKHTDSGQLIVGVSEHVTYWNQLGWSDPFSSPAYTERQNAYGERFHLDSVYTPQMVINGEEQIVGSDSAGILRAIQKEEQRPQLSLHIVSASVSDNSLAVDFSFNGSAPGRGVDIFAILADDTAKSNVLHGENSGRTLLHTAVARSITRLATIQTSTERTVHIPLSTSAQIPASQGRHLILFAQVAGLGRVLGVDTKAL
jgi:hypothetical protein